MVNGVFHSETDCSARQRQQSEQQNSPIDLRLTLDELVLHSYSHIQNQMALEFAVDAGKHDVANGREFHSQKFAARIKDTSAVAALVSFF